MTKNHFGEQLPIHYNRCTYQGQTLHVVVSEFPKNQFSEQLIQFSEQLIQFSEQLIQFSEQAKIFPSAVALVMQGFAGFGSVPYDVIIKN